MVSFYFVQETLKIPFCESQQNDKIENLKTFLIQHLPKTMKNYYSGNTTNEKLQNLVYVKICTNKVQNNGRIIKQLLFY